LRAVDLGADEFLDKPVDRAILLRRAHVLLALKATAEALELRHRELRLLHERQKELTAFLVHDLKNPLAVIHHGVAWLTSELEGTDGSVAAALDDISTSSRRLIDMIAEMLAVSRMEAEPAPSRQGMSMDDLLPALVKEHSHEARSRGVTLDVEMNQKIEIFADAAMLRRALDNLLENALRHTPTGGRIALAATIDQSCTHVAVSNTGHAIPASEHHRIFEKFRSAKGAYTRASVGLGLYFCRQVAEAHGGTIELTSTRQWPVRFTLRIPHFG
jgi:signal transduction histidine kinase